MNPCLPACLQSQWEGRHPQVTAALTTPSNTACAFRQLYVLIGWRRCFLKIQYVR